MVALRERYFRLKSLPTTPFYNHRDEINKHEYIKVPEY